MILLLIEFILLFKILALKQKGSYRLSVIKSWVIVFFLTIFATELLSLFNILNFVSLIVFWSLVLFGSLMVLLGLSERGSRIPCIYDRKRLLNFDWQDWLGVAVIFFVLGITFLIAILAPPNTFDSMTYHMARVAEWIQHHSVRFYPTNIPRQNHAMPLAEFAILHLQILSKSDRFANLVQWAGFLVSMITATIITKELGASRKAQLFSGFLVATIPMAILQSSSTQNDLVVGAFCMIFAYFMLRFVKTVNIENVFFASLSLGLSLLTKGTAYLFCAGVGLGIGVIALIVAQKNTTRRRYLAGFMATILGALMINGGHYARNIQLYGHPLSTANSRITVDNVSLQNTVANTVRNTAIHYGAPFQSVNDALTNGIRSMLGVNADDPATTFDQQEFRVEFFINEDYAGNPFHAILMAVAIPAFFLTGRGNKRYDGYLAAVVLGFVFFNMFIKWQPWSSRLQTPIFMLGTPLISIFVHRGNVSKGVQYVLIIIILFLNSLPFLFLNETRPLLPLFEQGSALRTNKLQRFFSDRPKLYNELSSVLSPLYKDQSVLHTERGRLIFMSDPSHYRDYLVVMREVQKLNPDVLGLCLGSNDWEYPFWVLADRHASRGTPTFRHVGVDNITRRFVDSESQPPEYVLATRAGCSRLQGFQYQEIFDSESVRLLKKSN